MNLSLSERLTILNVLPKEGSIVTMTIVKDVKKKVSITQEEISKYEIRQETQDGLSFLTWKKEAMDYIIEADFSELEKKEIKSSFETLDKNKKVTEEMLDLIEKINV